MMTRKQVYLSYKISSRTFYNRLKEKGILEQLFNKKIFTSTEVELIKKHLGEFPPQ